MNKIPFAALKRKDLLAYLEGLGYEPRRESNKEWSIPCPLSGCTSTEDGFHLLIQPTGRWVWFCHSCGKRGDIVDLVAHQHNCTMNEAWAIIEKGNLPEGPRRTMKTSTSPTAWHSKAQEMVARRTQPTTSLRGLTPRVCNLFKVGLSTFRGRPAMMIPWIKSNGHISAIQYRFLDKQSPRYSMLAGSKRIIFGAHLCRKHLSSFLWIVEGEINAMSIHQVTRNQATDVVSLGCKNGSGNKEVLPQFINHFGYKKVAVWMDELEDAQTLASFLANESKAKAEAIDPDAWDANDLLQQGDQALWHFLDSSVLWTTWEEAEP